MFGHCHLRGGLRTFAPARIESLKLTGQRFQRPKDFTIESALRDSFGVRSGQDQYKVVIRFQKIVADYIREKKWHSSQELRELPTGQVELTMRLSSLIEVQRWILSWAGDAEVLEPAELKKSIHEAAKKIAAGTIG
jgi:proteasome accessory factor B